MTYPDGKIYEYQDKFYIGKLVNGKKEGFGILYGEDGERIYIGHWLDDQRHGEGYAIDYKDLTVLCLWEKG